MQSQLTWKKDIHAGVAQEEQTIILVVNDKWQLLSRDMKEAYVKESWTWFFQMGKLANISEKSEDYSFEVRHNQSNRTLATWDAIWGLKLRE